MRFRDIFARSQQRGGSRPRGSLLAVFAGSAALVLALAAAGEVGASTRSLAGNPHQQSTTCQLGNGVKHVVVLTFDNVHFFRDNPNVPSDLEMMPNLLNFFEQNGTFLSNSHTPLIAHTADDILTTLTGLYGDRQGMPVSNSYRTFNPDGTTDPAGSFAYWTDPVYNTATTPSPGHDTNPSMVYSATPPATTTPPPTPNTTTPAPWVSYTRAGCDVGGGRDREHRAREHRRRHPQGVRARLARGDAAEQRPRQLQGSRDRRLRGRRRPLRGRQRVLLLGPGGEVRADDALATAVSDVLPDEPGGYNGFQALFGHRYVAPQLGAGTPNVTHNGYQVTNAAGNLVDLNGNQINGAFLDNYPGFPGFSSINAAQSLAYVADMQESGVPVTYAYISDIHGNESIPGLSSQGEPCYQAPAALGSGSACYVAQAQYYNEAFGTFFKRLAADGITRANTLFVLSSDEGDHEAGANVGRAIQPTPANCDGATVSGTTVTPDVACTYPAGSFGELAGNLTGLLATEKDNTTPFGLEADTAPEFYLNGNPSPSSAVVRTFDRDVGSLTAANPYTGGSQTIANYLADPTEEAILHMVNADPLRTPTLALFAKPDYFLSSGAATCSPCVTQNTGFAWDHGDYAAEIDTNYVGFVGPGVANLGLDGSGPADGPNSAGADSGQTTVPGSGTTGTWVDETDIRPTIMYLLGLTDDYVSDGRVISEILTQPRKALASPWVTQLGQCYKQINSSVGEFGTDTLMADTKAIASGTNSPGGDTEYSQTVQALTTLEQTRDQVAGQIKQSLNGAEFGGPAVNNPKGQLDSCNAVLAQAQALTG